MNGWERVRGLNRVWLCVVTAMKAFAAVSKFKIFQDQSHCLIKVEYEDLETRAGQSGTQADFQKQKQKAGIEAMVD